MPTIDCIEKAAGLRHHEIVTGIILMAKEEQYCEQFCTVPDLKSWATDRGLFLPGMNSTYSKALLGLISREQVFTHAMIAQNYDPLSVMSRLNEVAQGGHLCAAQKCTFSELKVWAELWATVSKANSSELSAAANALRCPAEEHIPDIQLPRTNTCTAAVRLQGLGQLVPAELMQLLLTQALSHYASNQASAQSTVDVSIHPLTPSQCHHPMLTSACFEVQVMLSPLEAINVLKHFVNGSLNLTGIMDGVLDAQVDSEFCKYADGLSELEELLPRYAQELVQTLGVRPEMLSIGTPQEVQSTSVQQQDIDLSSITSSKTFKVPVKLDISISSSDLTRAPYTPSAKDYRQFDAMHAAGHCRSLEDRDGGASSSTGQAFFLGVMLPVGFSLLSLSALTFMYAHLNGYDGNEPDAAEPLPNEDKDETRLLQSTAL